MSSGGKVLVLAETQLEGVRLSTCKIVFRTLFCTTAILPLSFFDICPQTEEQYVRYEIQQEVHVIKISEPSIIECFAVCI